MPREPRAVATAFAGLWFLQLATLTPAFAPSAIYQPQEVSARGGWFFLGLVAASIALILLGAIRCLRGRSSHVWRVPMLGASLLLALVFVAFAGASAYYGRFGNYPTPALLADFFAAPSVFVGYASSDTSRMDLVLLLVTIVIGAVVSTGVTRLVWNQPGSIAGSVTTMLAGAALLWGAHAYPPRTADRQHGFLIAEHSLPAAKYVFQWLASARGNSVEAAQTLLPRAETFVSPPSPRKPRHVLLVIAEAVRADHLAAYGYQRHTMPFLEAEAGRWVVFQRAYSHGSRTADSFPVIFNSRYFAAIDHSNDGARALWRGLRSGGVRSAFLSAGAMQWSGVAQAIDFADVDLGMMASDFAREERHEISTRPFDYAVDDGHVVKQYVSLMSSSFRNERSFVTLHLVGSHYPFQYSDVPDEYLPSVGHPAAAADSGTVQLQNYDTDADVSKGRLAEIGNAYDNSLRHIDKALREAVTALDDLGMSDDSVVIFTSDHGESLGEHRTLFHGTTLYEEQVHVPLLIRVGRNVAPTATRLSTRAGHVVGQIDLIPTIYQLLPGNAPVPRQFQGQSWLDSVAKPYELLLFRGIGEKLAIVTDNRKLLFDVPGGRAEEYDLSVDPREQHDLWQGDESTSAGFVREVERRRAHGFQIGRTTDSP